MIAIFSTEAKANTYANEVHNWLIANRTGYNATKWTTPTKAATEDIWYVKKPIENPQVASLTQKQTETLPMPEVGQPCTKDTYYIYKGDIIKCRQTHNRAIYDPKDTPALFSYYRDNSTQLQWIAGEQVQVGWMRIYNGVKYEVSQAHQTQSDWTPNVAITLWKIYVDPTLTAAWAYPVSYIKNQQVTYLGKTYKCLQAHTSNSAWTPTAANTLWQLVI